MLPQTDMVANYLLSSPTPEEVAEFDRLITMLSRGLEARDGEGRSLFLEHARPSDPATD